MKNVDDHTYKYGVQSFLKDKIKNYEGKVFRKTKHSW